MTAPTSRRPPARSRRRQSIAVPGALLGIGLGGFVDGIVLHQLLQWHHMISAEESPTTLLGLERNTLADGLFHAGTWLAVLAGVAMLWSRALRTGHTWAARELWGWMLVGWGGFNVADGIVNHQLLGLHHVRDDLGGPMSWDIGFLALGIALVAAGWLLRRPPQDAGM
ncbi:MAG: hypothetical protein AVDCRST_MAG29-1009 [uncultured Nocardioidaceae bacterium]|uniref:DUF2243 domain-containing protein n=1 Tax=uncultured Nocardioidaceae bacterium TaxID=253824 RepID=A0A6J4LDH0_9ACTN|nr:MAG: hypothetical protein AVDCRST_MAG29-1009 [uncultured Nocardioidaceae bacterium]